MNFLYFLTLLMVISSASNGEIYQNGSDDNFCPLNFNPSAYHLSVPVHFRLAVTFVLILMLTASYYLETILLEEHFDYENDITVTYLVKMLIYHSFAVGLAFWFAPDQLEFGILLSYGICVTAYDYYTSSMLMHIILVRLVHLTDPPIHFVFYLIDEGLSVICAIVTIGVHFLLAYMTVMSVYRENFSAFIHLTIILAMAVVGISQMSSRFGQLLFSNAMSSLMMVVNVKLLVTLTFALNKGKPIWPLTTTVIMAILLIFTIRHFTTSLVCKYPRGQPLFNIQIFWNLLSTLQLAFICVLGYLTALIYSFFTDGQYL